MSTAAAYGFVIGGKEKITYCNNDGYPTGLGLHMLQAIQTYGIGLKEAAVMIQMVDDEESLPSKREIEKYFEYSGKSEGQKIKDWYDLLRNTQGDITVHLNAKVRHMIDYSQFLSDSGGCRWAYIINFDTGNFEIYGGCSNLDPKAAGRYAALQHPMNLELEGGMELLYGVVLIRKISLSDIRGMDVKEYMTKLSVETKIEYKELAKENSEKIGNRYVEKFEKEKV